MRKFFFLPVFLFCVMACRHTQPSPWQDANLWYADEAQPQTTYPADVFYITSTEVIASVDSTGTEVFNALLTDEERSNFYAEMDYVHRRMGDSLNFFAPYYHQFTMNAILLPTDSFLSAFKVATQDVQAAFDYYIQYLNPSRPFVLVGFSQGAMIIPELLKTMTEEAYQRCKGAYMLGYRLTKEDMACARIQPAVSATEGLVVSFNSVTSPDRQWDFISEHAATCINPLNWRTDTTPATLYFQQDTIVIAQDTVSHLLCCDVDTTRYIQPGTETWYKHGCLHHWDLLFYLPALHENILLRTRPLPRPTSLP